MECEICGTPLDRPGQGHHCRTGRAVAHPAAETFALAGRRVFRSGVVYAVVVLAVNALAYAGYTAVRNGAADVSAVGTQASVVLSGVIAGLVTLVCAAVLLISTLVWVVSAHRLRPAGPGLIGYGVLIVCVVLTALAYVLPRRMPTLGGSVATEVALRVGGLAVLIAGVMLVRARIGPPVVTRTPGRVTSDDWDASKWDPEVLRDIDRRRKSNDPFPK